MTNETDIQDDELETVAADAETEGEPSEPVVEDGQEIAVDPVMVLEAEKADLKDKLLRTLAEADNIRKRAERRVADERVYAVEKFARDMLGVVDNLSRALTALPHEDRAELSDAGKSLLEGIEMTEKDLIATLARHGVTAIDAVAGVTFDPNVHQAVAQIPSDHPEGTVAEPFQTGWKLGERTLRAAMVAVSTGTAAE